MRMNNPENNKKLKHLIHLINSKERHRKYNNHLDYNNLLCQYKVKIKKKIIKMTTIKRKASSSTTMMINKKPTKMNNLRKNQCQKRKYQYSKIKFMSKLDKLLQKITLNLMGK